MADYRISFMNDMIHAYQRGDKTQTRRVINGPGNQWHIDRLLGDWSLSEPPYQYDGTGWTDGAELPWNWRGRGKPKVGDWIWEVQCSVDDTSAHPIRNPYGQPGDRLLFLEGYQILATDDDNRVCVNYLSDDTTAWKHLTAEEYSKWKARKYPYRATPGRFMYNSLVRYMPPVLRVGVERVQEISEEDCAAEGISAPGYPDVAREMFAELWDTINVKRGYSWKANPWVWVTEFERHTNERQSR